MVVTFTLSPPTASAILPKSVNVATTLSGSAACAGEPSRAPLAATPNERIRTAKRRFMVRPQNGWLKFVRAVRAKQNFKLEIRAVRARLAQKLRVVIAVLQPQLAELARVVGHCRG